MTFRGMLYQVSIAKVLFGKRKPASRGGRLFRKDNRGVAALEFAIVAAPLIALLLATFETTITLFTQQVLETASEKAARTILTGTAQRGGTTQTQFKNQVCASFPSYMKCNNVIVDVRVASSISNADTGSPTLTYDINGNVTNIWSYNMGGNGDVVVVKTMYLMDTVGGPLGFNLANTRGNKRLLISTYVFRNEG